MASRAEADGVMGGTDRHAGDGPRQEGAGDERRALEQLRQERGTARGSHGQRDVAAVGGRACEPRQIRRLFDDRSGAHGVVGGQRQRLARRFGIMPMAHVRLETRESGQRFGRRRKDLAARDLGKGATRVSLRDGDEGLHFANRRRRRGAAHYLHRFVDASCVERHASQGGPRHAVGIDAARQSGVARAP